MSLKKELIKIYAENGIITPEAVLKEASKPDSPLHSYFKWKDSEAARLYRLQQAHRLIISIREIIELEDKKITTRKFVNILKDEDGNYLMRTNSKDTESTYHDIQDVIKEDDKLKYMIERGKNELNDFKKRYENYSVFSGVITAIEEI